MHPLKHKERWKKVNDFFNCKELWQDMANHELWQNEQYIKKQRPYFTDKGPSSQVYSFSSRHVWMESWTIKKAEHQRIDAFELWYWRRLLQVPWPSKRSNQSILKINLKYSSDGLMLKLKLQYFGQLMWRNDSLEKTLMLGKIEGRRRRGRQRMTWLDDIINLMDMSLSKLWGLVKDRKAWRVAVHGVIKSRTRLSNWSELKWTKIMYLL